MLLPDLCFCEILTQSAAAKGTPGHAGQGSLTVLATPVVLMKTCVMWLSHGLCLSGPGDRQPSRKHGSLDTDPANLKKMGKFFEARFGTTVGRQCSLKNTDDRHNWAGTAHLQALADSAPRQTGLFSFLF